MQKRLIIFLIVLILIGTFFLGYFLQPSFSQEDQINTINQENENLKVKIVELQEEIGEPSTPVICNSKQDCIAGGECDVGLECTCYNNKCYTGFVAGEKCNASSDCKNKIECTQPEAPLCFSVPYCGNTGICSCAQGCT